MTVKFGTSGVRGLANDLNDLVCSNYMKSFIRHLELLPSNGIAKKMIFAGDFRQSTPRVKQAMMDTALNLGYEVFDADFAPTPALAYACSQLNAPGVMVTGSHIPADRNGFKFYFPWGEILKSDEETITQNYINFSKSERELKNRKNLVDSPSLLASAKKLDIVTPFIERYTKLFSAQCLIGTNIVFYQHSTLAQLVIPQILTMLGAEVTLALPSSSFLSVDTEAFDANEELLQIIQHKKPFATLSADGDGDRPLLIDENSVMIPGDVLGLICCKYLHADYVVTPVTSNSALENQGFKHIQRTRVGSPYVIEEMLRAHEFNSKVCCGFEANGGFLLGSDVELNGKILRSLPTRDSVLPSLIPIIMAKAQGISLRALVEQVKPLSTHSDLIRNFDSSKSVAVLERAIDEFCLNGKGPIKVDKTDGLRFYFEDENIIHLRPSGNAPEFRIYTESKTKEAAMALAVQAREFIISS